MPTCLINASQVLGQSACVLQDLGDHVPELGTLLPVVLYKPKPDSKYDLPAPGSWASLRNMGAALMLGQFMVRCHSECFVYGAGLVVSDLGRPIGHQLISLLACGVHCSLDFQQVSLWMVLPGCGHSLIMFP